MILFENDILDNYKLIQPPLGEGGMGLVYKAISFKNNNEVALKYCKFSDELSIRRFKREVRAIHGIDHRNVMQILDMNLDFNPPYYTMPIATGSAFDMLEELSFNHTKAIDIFLEACKGVQAIHNAGQCHRDIKPHNIMVMSDDVIVISDFGLVKFMERDTTMLTKTTTLLGTEIYMAPEQFLPEGARNSDIRTDIYQLGKTLYHLYTGTHPALLSDEGIPAGLWYIIQKAVKQNPNDRFSNVAELIDSVNDYKASQDPYLNPKEAFSIILQQINDKLANDIFEKNDVQKLVRLLMNNSDDETFFLQLFDQIPLSLLNSMASDMSSYLEAVIKTYAEIIERLVSQHSFEYADTVAQKMSVVYSATLNITIKQGALKSILYAAVNLNRFNAMDVFNSLLIRVVTPEEALAVSDILKMHLYKYKRIYSQISKGQLHPILQIVWELASQQQ